MGTGERNDPDGHEENIPDGHGGGRLDGHRRRGNNSDGHMNRNDPDGHVKGDDPDGQRGRGDTHTHTRV